MRSLRLVPYWSVHETLGVDAHNAPLKMRTRRIHLSRAVAWSCVRRHPVAGAALGSTDVEGSDPPVRGPGTGSGRLRVFTPLASPLGGSLPIHHIPTREGGLSAASRRRITRSPTGRPSGSRASPSKAGVPPMARATAQAAKSGTRPSQVTDGLPARDCWTGATSRRRVDGRAHPTLPDAVPGIEKGGSLRSRPQAPERHRRSGGRGATAKQPATCGTPGAHMEAAFSCTCMPMSMCTRGTPPTPADRRSRSAPPKTARAPCPEPVDRRSGPRGPEPVLQLDDPLEAALQPAMLLDHRVVHAADRLLDPGDLAAGRIDGAGGGGCLGPVPENRPCPLHLPAGAYDGDDL